MKKPTYALLFAALLTTSAFAQVPNQHAGHEMPKPMSGAPEMHSNVGYEAANARMHRDMSIRFSGNADRDFLAGMIPHHQGAIDMAEVELKYGKDPKVRRLAKNIIRAQKQEIAMMREWLARTR